MKSVRKKLKGRYCRRVITYFLTCCLILNTSLSVVLAEPTGGTFTVGTGTITPPGIVTDVVVGQLESVIEWTSLDTDGSDPGPRESLNFFDGGFTNAAVLNRVSGAETQFYGDLTADAGMRIFIVNPAGIFFGEGSTVNVTQLVASGLNMSNQAFSDFLDGTVDEMVFDGGDGKVENRGTINAESVYLVGNEIVNWAGMIETPAGGLVVMAAGDRVYLSEDGSNVAVELDSDPGGDPVDIFNGTMIYSPEGKIVLAAGDTFSRAIVNGGHLNAARGEVTADAASVTNYGIINTAHTLWPQDGDAGDITLTGKDEVVLAAGSSTVAYAVQNGNGGDITLQSEGTITIGEGAVVNANGGSAVGDDGIAGDGGTVKITCENFVIAGEIEASADDGQAGTLWIDPADVTIADGENLGAINTLYEDDIETLSQGGTNLVVEAEGSITVEDLTGIDDDEITGGIGGITLHATGADSSVSFDDPGDTIRTSLGDIIIEAGSNGINIGNLVTGKDDASDKPDSGQIILTTDNGGDIETGSLIVEDGWGHAEINVDASGDLTVNGAVIVGAESDILNVPDQANAEAMIYLSAGDNVVLEGNVGAYAHGKNATELEDDVTMAYIGIFAGTDDSFPGDATINGDIMAFTKSSQNGTSESTIEISTWGDIFWGIDADDPVADGDNGEVRVVSKTTKSDPEEAPEDGDFAQIIINAQQNKPEPGIPITKFDVANSHMSTAVVKDTFENGVLGNDIDPEGDPITAAQYIDGTHLDVQHGTLMLNEDGTYTYEPDAGYVGEDSFWYTATDGEYTSGPELVTITVENSSPVGEYSSGETHMGTPLTDIDLLSFVTDADNSPTPTDTLTIDSFDQPSNGTLTYDAGTETYIYEPDEEGYTGPDSFTYYFTDGELDYLDPENPTPVLSSDTFEITMTNGLPVANDGTAVTDMGVPVDGSLNYSDTPDPAAEGATDPLAVELVGAVEGVLTTENGGTVTLTDGTYTYTPAEDYTGKDSFMYSVTDGEIDAVPAQGTVTITVNPGEEPPPPPPPVPVLPYMTAAPGLERIEIEFSGCPALMSWVAQEIGVDERMVQIWVVNTLASTRDIQPCNTCSSLKQAATILQDAEGTHMAALALVINEFASSTAPPTEEQMASIADAIARNTEADNQYYVAGEYLDALVDYVGILNMEMGFSLEESVELAMNKYVGQLTDSGNVGLAAYVAARLAALGG